MLLKKLAVLLIVLSFAVLPVISVSADPTLPPELADALSKTSWAGWEVIDGLVYNDTNEAFISLRKDSTNRVAYATRSGNTWKIRWCNYNPLPQGNLSLRLVDRTNTEYAGLKLKKAFSFTPNQPDNYESIYEKNGKQWLLREIVLNNADGSLGESFVITNSGVKYNGPQSKTPNLKIDGVVQRDLQYFPYKAFPKDLKKLRAGLSTPPSIPSGTLIPQDILFKGGKRYEVYSGPGEHYIRGGNGKAAVSTNDWIQVFGSENGWIMIQYNIGKDHMRIGWIPETSLPDNVDSVKELEFEGVAGTTTENTSLTDDPLASKGSVASLPKGSKLKLLATMGDWVYVEYADGQPVRGFVPVGSVTADSAKG